MGSYRRHKHSDLMLHAPIKDKMALRFSSIAGIVCLQASRQADREGLGAKMQQAMHKCTAQEAC